LDAALQMSEKARKKKSGRSRLKAAAVPPLGEL